MINKLLQWRHFWFVAGLIVLMWVVHVNAFPQGFVIAGEDTAQMINQAGKSFKFLFYEWQSRASLFYSIFYVLDWLGVSDTTQLSWYLGIFLFGSYLSFDIFVRLVFGKVNNLIRCLVSLFYALNLYTLYLFVYDWGYSYYQSLYIFIPLLIGLYVKFLQTERGMFGAWFVLVLFLASSGFSNPAFALALGIVLILLTILLFVVGWFKCDWLMARKVVTLGLMSALVSAYWISPLILQIRAGVENIASANIIDLGWWLQHTSNPIIDTFRLMQFNGKSFFPLNFPYESIHWMKDLFVVLTTFPMFFILYAFIQWRSISYLGKSIEKLFWAFSGLLVILVMLVARVRPPFEKFNNFFFQLPGLNTLRGYEKFAIFTPFVIAVIILFALLLSQKKKYFSVVIGIFIAMLLIPLPFYVGKLQQNTSFIFANEKEKDYRESDYSFLVKIPQEYYDIQKVLNNDSEDVKVAGLPYNVIGSIGWANYPKWKLQGSDITALLYNKTLINPNSFYFNQWLYGKSFNEFDQNPEWIVKLLGSMNVGYVLYHTDVDGKFIDQSIDKIKYLEYQGLLTAVESNDYFTLYRVRNDYVLPYVFLEQSNISVQEFPMAIDKDLDRIKDRVRDIKYQRVSPKQITILNQSFKKGSVVVLNEPYDSNWVAYYNNGSQKTELSHVRALGYANGWSLEKDMQSSGVITIEYRPMEWFYRGAIISAIALLLSLSYIIWNYFYERKQA